MAVYRSKFTALGRNLSRGPSDASTAAAHRREVDAASSHPKQQKQKKNRLDQQGQSRRVKMNPARRVRYERWKLATELKRERKTYAHCENKLYYTGIALLLMASVYKLMTLFWDIFEFEGWLPWTWKFADIQVRGLQPRYYMSH
ncbi:hypothetical protein EJ08DRAFT_658366 [Tothia fuscella]|uniref:Uncharacterized protein n=1 Tax=Tothia fuscella TaxID=1048955 RepID=A0A9P4NVJ6_9PEZI|nr:hypothetical protein EJ08DRAFT_658366 [Tothia fuscella]